MLLLFADISEMLERISLLTRPGIYLLIFWPELMMAAPALPMVDDAIFIDWL